MMESLQNEWDVFVSHNSCQKPWVRSAVDQWRDLGLQVFFDEDSIPPGFDVVSTIEHALETSNCVVVVISPSSISSHWVAFEAACVLYAQTSSDNSRLVPLILEHTDPSKIRPSIRRLNCITLTNGERRRSEYHRLLRRLGVDSELLPDPPEWPNQDDKPGNLEPESHPAGSSSTTTFIRTKKVQFDLVVRGDYSSMNDDNQQRLLNAIHELLATDCDIQIIRKRIGSVILRLELAEYDAQRLFWLVKSGSLENAGVSDAIWLQPDTYGDLSYVQPGIAEGFPRERVLGRHNAPTVSSAWSGIQQKFIHSSPEIPGLPIAIVSDCDTQGGGDYCDTFLLGNHDVFIGIGDISGNGPAQAFSAAIAHGMIRGMLEGGLSLPTVALQLNRLMLSYFQPSFFTFLGATISARTGACSFLVAGHISPFLVNGSGECRELELARTLPLGVSDGLEIPVDACKLSAGDKLVFITDGILEASSETESFFGRKRLLEVMARPSSQESPQRLADNVIREVSQFRRPGHYDDATILVAEWSPQIVKAVEPKNRPGTAVEEIVRDPKDASTAITRSEVATSSGQSPVIVFRFRERRLDDEVTIGITKTLIEEAFAGGTSSIILDFSGVEFMSSVMLSKLISLHKRARNERRRLVLTGLPPSIVELFAITKLIKMFEIRDTVDQACHMLQETPG